MLDYLYQNEINAATLRVLYQLPPFCHSKESQYPGSVFRYGFIKLADVDTSRAHDGYSRHEWVSYKQTLFRKLCTLIKINGTRSVSAIDCATILHRIATMYTYDSKIIKGLDFIPLVTDLISQLHDQRRKANTQVLSNTLWSFARLAKADCLSDMNTTLVNDLLECLHTQRENATPQHLANTLWALAKLTEANSLSDINTHHVSSLLKRMHAQRAQATTQELANTLWALAKLTEAGLLSVINANYVNDLLERLHAHRSQATPQELANALWALAKLVEADSLSVINANFVNDLLRCLNDQRIKATTQNLNNAFWASSIINTVVAVEVPAGLVSLAYCLSQVPIPLNEKRQVLMGLGLLGLDPYYDTKTLIAECRPVSLLRYKNIEPYIKGAESFQKEAFLSGFFVDLLVVFSDGKKKIIEFDGRFHQAVKQKAFDSFRDKILTQQGFEILRIKWNENNKHAFFKPHPESSIPFTKNVCKRSILHAAKI